MKHQFGYLIFNLNGKILFWNVKSFSLSCMFVGSSQRQNFIFDFSMWGQIMWNFKKRINRLVCRIKSLVYGSFCPYWTFQVQKRQVEMWIWAKVDRILTFDLSVQGQILWNFKNAIKLTCSFVLKPKLLVCDNFCPHRTYRIRMISQNVIWGRK